MDYWERVEKLRKAKGISQRDLERELDFSNGSYAKGKYSMPTMYRIRKLADYFNVPIEYFYGQCDLEDISDNVVAVENTKSDLTLQEKRMLAYFRLLNPEKQEAFLGIAKTLAEDFQGIELNFGPDKK